MKSFVIALGLVTASSSFATFFNAYSSLTVNVYGSAHVTASDSEAGFTYVTGTGSASVQPDADIWGPSFEVTSRAWGSVTGLGTASAAQYTDLTLFFSNKTSSTITGFFSVFAGYLATTGDSYTRASAGFSATGSLLNRNGSVESSFVPGGASNFGSQNLDIVTYSLRPGETQSVQFKAWAEGYAEPVPEPASMAALGLGALAALRRRKRSS